MEKGTNIPIEQRVADTILQRATEIKIGARKYQVAPPSVATLILISEAVAKLPTGKLDENNIVGEVLAVAKDCEVLGEIAAILILGAKKVGEVERIAQTTQKTYFGGLITRTNTQYVEVSRLALLKKEILETLSPAELHSLIARLLQGLDLSDFFAVTTFLTEINLLRRTKVETKMTAFGQ